VLPFFIATAPVFMVSYILIYISTVLQLFPLNLHLTEFIFNGLLFVTISFPLVQFHWSNTYWVVFINATPSIRHPKVFAPVWVAGGKVSTGFFYNKKIWQKLRL
jgi:hypothetical protein